MFSFLNTPQTKIERYKNMIIIVISFCYTWIGRKAGKLSLLLLFGFRLRIHFRLQISVRSIAEKKLKMLDTLAKKYKDRKYFPKESLIFVLMDVQNKRNFSYYLHSVL